MSDSRRFDFVMPIWRHNLPVKIIRFDMGVSPRRTLMAMKLKEPGPQEVAMTMCDRPSRRSIRTLLQERAAQMRRDLESVESVIALLPAKMSPKQESALNHALERVGARY